MKQPLLLLALFVTCFQINAQTITITESSGWLESAFVTWLPVEGVDSYNIYYTGGGLTDQMIDTQLIRSYGSYFRADILGLAADGYTFKVVPVTGTVEGPATISDLVDVIAHDRNGFAHSDGHIPGAYNPDGTLKPNAVVLYITENSKNSISLNVTGANSNPCIGLQTILDGFKKGDDNRPLSVRLIGNITDLNFMYNGDVVIENDNNSNGSITFEGVGSDAVVNGWGLRIKKGTNIEVRNLGFMLTDANEGDNIGIQQDNDHIWVHNCDLFYGSPGSASDQAKGDGALDCKRSTDVTISYNHFWDTGKSNLLGLSENTTTDLYVTYHHNWYDHSDSRHPRVRFYSAHIYNNYFDGISKYGAGSTEGSSLFVEGNYFRNCKYPMLTSKQGTDIFGGSQGTFSDEDGGTIKAFDNYIIGETRFVAYDPVTYPVQFDAYVAATRSENVSSSITSNQGSNTYNNFDTNPALYVNSLVIDSPEEAKTKVMQFSGRVAGGDLSWTFDNAVDDSSHAVNIGLQNALLNYSSELVFVQGDGGSQTLEIPGNNVQTVLSGPINDMVFTWGGTAIDATVSGLPDSGINFSKDVSAKTITVFGTPTADVSFTITTVGDSGEPAVGTGTIYTTDTPTGDEIHNFTLSGLSSSFYTFTSANMNSNPGSTTFDGLSLTERLKIESATLISYNTSSISTLTLVLDPGFSGRIKLDNVSYSAVDGVVIIPDVPSGAHAITKDNVANLYYIKTEMALNIATFNNKNEVRLFPNPIANTLTLQGLNTSVENVSIYELSGRLVKTFQINKSIETIDLSSLSSGSYILKIETSNGMVSKKILKN